MSGPPSERRVRRGSGGITLADVARIAGVAAITASRALRNPKWVAPATLERVREAVQRTGYVHNSLAGGLASSRSNLVVTIVPTISSPMFAPTVEALGDALQSQGYEMMVGLSGYSTDREDRLLGAILSRRPAGVVLTGSLHSAEGRRALTAAHIPIVETWDLTPTPIGRVVGFSNERIGAELAQFLHARGRRRPASLSGDDRRALIRANTFVDTYAALGLPGAPIATVHAPSSVSDGRAGLTELLRRTEPPDAVICSTDVLALGVLIEAQARGLRVPQDLAIIGFGDLVYSRVSNPSITTVQIDGAAIGRHAADFILAHHSGKPPGDRIVDVGYTILERQST